VTVDEIRAVVRLSTMVDSGEISDAQLLLYINECIHDVSMRDDWDWLQAVSTFSTAAGTRNYLISGLASGDEAQTIRFVMRNNEEDILHPISYEQALTRWGDDFDSGTPVYWYINRERIGLLPVPSAIETINVHYVRPPSELTAGADTPAWLSTFHALVVDYVESRVWEQQEDFAKAQMAKALYFDRIDMMRRAYMKRQNTGPWVLGAGRSTRTGRREPYRNDWAQADV
jgi:hypothetical protein